MYDLIKAKILLNHSHESYKSICNVIYEYQQENMISLKTAIDLMSWAKTYTNNRKKRQERQIC